MIQRELNNAVTGNLEGVGEVAHMGFAEGAEAHLMRLLTRMYSDPLLAVIRELSNNAWDSHVAAGHTDPIHVTLPSALQPYISIRDSGVGLSVEDVHSLYSKYGASTKRDSNEVTGFMGIGSKAPLAYQSQFTTVAVKDGVKATVIVSIKPNGTGDMQIIDTSNTDEPNGVEVQVPIKAQDMGRCEQTAREFFSYWHQGQVVLNGKEPKHVGGMIIATAGQDGQEYTIRLLDDSDRQTRSRILMGGVAYPTDKLGQYDLGIPYGYSIVAEVPLGTVDIAPSREALEYTTETNIVIGRIKDSFKKAFVAAIQEQIENASRPSDAIRLYNKWSRVLGQSFSRNHQWKFKGKPMPTQLKLPGVDPQTSIKKYPDAFIQVTQNSDYKMGSTSSVQAIDLSYFDKSMFITDYDMAKFTPTHKKKLMMFVTELNDARSKADPQLEPLAVNSFVLVNFPLTEYSDWIAPERIVGWSGINALKLPKTERTYSGGRLKGSFDTIRKDKDNRARYYSEVKGDDIDMTKPVYWVWGNYAESSAKAGALETVEEEFTIVLLPQNRIDKFKRENPSVTNLEDALKGKFEAWFKALTEQQRLVLSVNAAGAYDELTKVGKHADKFDDPAVVKAANAVHGVDRNALVNKLNFWRRVAPVDVTIDKYESPMDKYPMFAHIYHYESNESAFEYVNALYAYRQES